MTTPAQAIGRPGRDEAGPYFYKYIDLIASDDIVAALESQRGEALAFLRGISEERSLHRYAPDKWSMRELLGHVNDGERVFSYRALWFARAADTPLPGFDQDPFVVTAKSDGIAWAALVEELAALRAASLSLFRNLPAEAWSRRGIANDTSFTVRALAYVVAGHVAHHLAVLKERYA